MEAPIKTNLKKQEHLVKLGILSTAAVLCTCLSAPHLGVCLYVRLWWVFFFFFIFSICYAIIFGAPIRKCYTWIWSVLQLSNNALSHRRGILQFSQLVRWSCMVSARTNHWRHHISGINGDIGRIVPHDVAAEHHNWHPKCVRIFGAVLLVTDHNCHVLADKRNSRKSRLNEGLVLGVPVDASSNLLVLPVHF